MKGSTWLLLGQLGSSFLRVVNSEWQAVRADIRRSAQVSASALLSWALAVAFMVVALTALTFSAVELLSLALPRWASFLILAVVLMIGGGLLGMRARRQLHKIETPDAVVRRRWGSHRRWLRDQLTGTPSEDE